MRSTTARKTAADQALDFLRAAGLLALGRFAVGAFMRAARQHAVFGRHPAEPGIAQEGRNFFIDAGGAQHMRIAEFGEARAFGIFGGAGLKRDVAQGIGGAV